MGNVDDSQAIDDLAVFDAARKVRIGLRDDRLGLRHPKHDGFAIKVRPHLGNGLRENRRLTRPC